MSEAIERPDPVSDPEPDTAPGPVRPRPGAGPPGRPSLGWTEIGIAVVAWFVFSVVAILVTGMPGPQGQNTLPVLAGSALAFLLAVGIALAVRVRWLPAVGLRATTWRWLLAGVGVGVLMRALAFGLVLGYQAITGDLSDPLADRAAPPKAVTSRKLVGKVFGPPGAKQKISRANLDAWIRPRLPPQGGAILATPRTRQSGTGRPSPSRRSTRRGRRRSSRSRSTSASRRIAPTIRATTTTRRDRLIRPRYPATGSSSAGRCCCSTRTTGDPPSH